jgi:import receptor subunit TOM20
MASTTPSQSISTSTIVFASVGTLAAGALAYAVYFDYRRRTDVEFRKSLKKQHKKVSKLQELSAKEAEKGQKEKIRRVVEEANEEGFPRDPEETEGYFMQEVARGEGMCQDGSDPVDAALCFYKALKVYPQPRELISIYDKTVPKVCDFLLLFSSLSNRSLTLAFLAHPRHPSRDDRSRPQHICHRLFGFRGRFRQRRIVPPDRHNSRDLWASCTAVAAEGSR